MGFESPLFVRLIKQTPSQLSSTQPNHSTMTAPVPQSIPPSVAFEIPLEKKATDSPPIQKRLEEAATTPRKPFSISDVMKRLADASKRRDNVASASKAKASAHNSAVKKNVESFVGKHDEELENRINSKLDGADARRADLTARKLKKLAEYNKNTIGRGTKALSDAEDLSRLLEEKAEIKEEMSSLRKEQILSSKVLNLSVSNDSKKKRGQLAMELDGIEAAHKGNQLNQKLLSAAHRSVYSYINLSYY